MKEIPVHNFVSLQFNKCSVKFDAIQKAIVCYEIDGTYFANNFENFNPEKGYKHREKMCYFYGVETAFWCLKESENRLYV